MALINILLIAIVAGTVGLSTRFFSPQELRDRFEQGQKLYALGNYEKAIPHFEAILLTQSNTTINVENVTVTVDEFILPVKVAGTYQLANTFNKLGLEKLKRSQFLRAEKNDVEAQIRFDEALRDLDTSLDYFGRIIADEHIDERTRAMAQYQMVQTNYQLKRFEQAIHEAQALIDEYPNSVYETAAYYDIAWSYFELEQFRSAIENFREVLILSPSGSRSDRALLQIGDSYDRLGEYEEALDYLGRLIQRYDFTQMSQQEIIEMATLKLKGIVKETTRELVAKAQIKRGDIYGHQGEIEKALEAYAAVPRDYRAETRLVQDSYLRAAELVHETRGTIPAVNAYKYAIEHVEDKRFQAKTQLQVARFLFAEKEFKKAAEEYDIYIRAYADIAERVGFSLDKAVFRMGQSHQAQGEKMRQSDTREADAAFGRAIVLYRQMQEEYGDSELLPEVLFGLGFSHQLLGERVQAMASYRELIKEYPEHDAAPSALLQLARIQYEEGNREVALASYRRLLDDYPESSLRNTANMELGITHKRMGDVDAAIAAFETVEDDWNQWGKVQLELAELYTGKGDYEGAEQVLRRTLGAIDNDQLLGQLHYIKGKAHFAQSEYVEAVAELDKTLQGSAAAKVVESALLTRGASHYEIARQLDASGDSLQAQSSYEASLADLKRLLEEDPPTHIKDSAFRTLGASMIRLGREQEAAQYYEEVIAASPDSQERATFQMLLTELYFDMEDFAQALKHARELLAMEFADDNQAGYFRKERAFAIIGNVLLQQKKYQEAAKIFATGLEKYPQSGESANLSFSKALAQFSGGDYEAAVASFKNYIKGFPGHRNRIHGHYYLAHALQAMTHFEQAGAAFQELAERYPDSTYEEEGLFLVGENYYNERLFDLAAAAYTELLQQYPAGKYNDVAQYARAWSFFEQENMEEGVEAMEMLVSHYPHSEFASKAQFTVGDYYYNIRSYKQALKAYKWVVEQYPDSEEAQKAQGLVDELNEIQASFEYAEVMKLFDNSQYEEAVAGFKRLVENYPGTYTEMAAFCNLGMAYENLRQWSEAVAYYEKALEQAGDSPEHYDVVSFSRQHRDWIVENRL